MTIHGRTLTAALLLITLGLFVGCAHDPVADVDPVPPPSDATWIEPIPDAGMPAMTDAAPPVVEEIAPAPEPVIHVVAKGDTLWNLAAKYYGDGKQWKKIADANGITNEKKLSVGKKLVIPQ